MKAIVCHEYGLPELREIDQPPVMADNMLVRVRAAALNPLDSYFLMGKPYFARVLSGLRKPKQTRPGIDFAGTVEAVGEKVTQFRPGDEIFGAARGALAEYVCASESRIARKPTNVTFEQAAAVPIAGVTALQGLRDHGRIQPGQKVLINGASGGVGTFAVQIARAFGAEVTGVCSTKHVELVRSIGADRVIDYTREDFTRSDQRYDLLLDMAGSRSWPDCRRILKPQAIFVLAGGRKTNRWIGPLGQILKLRLDSLRDSRKVVMFVAKLDPKDLVVLKELIEAGKVTPVIDRCYELSKTSEAFAYLGEGHARGKVVVTIANEEPP